METSDKHYQLKIPLEKKRIYLVRRVEDVKDLKEALSTHTYSRISEIGHRIKGSARLFDFIELEELAIRLERAASLSQLDQLSELVSEFDFRLTELMRTT